MTKQSRLTPARLRQVFNYDADTGIFRPLVKRAGRKSAIGVGGAREHGYIMIGIDGERHRAHRLAWFYVYGEWPTTHLDHMNGITDDNRIANLRLATRRINAENRHAASTLSTTGALGVERRDGKKGPRWRAYICHEGKRYNLGTYATREEAASQYLGVKRHLHLGCTI